MSSEPFLVVAIDFGTTYSGFAFQFRHQYDPKDPTVMMAPQSWSDGTKQVLSLKTPTALLLTPDYEIDSFGYEAERKYSNLCEENKHTEYAFYRQFKMKLQSRGVSLISMHDTQYNKYPVQDPVESLSLYEPVHDQQVYHVIK